MVLTKKERAMVEELTRRQEQLELMLGSMLGGPLGRAGVMAYHSNPFDSPFTDLSQHNLAAARFGKQEGQRLRSNFRQTKTKIRRKVSPYQREFGRQLKKLKKKHPRTGISTLMKRAHRATKKVRK